MTWPFSAPPSGAAAPSAAIVGMLAMLFTFGFWVS